MRPKNHGIAHHIDQKPRKKQNQVNPEKTQFNNDNNNLVEKNLSDHSHAKPRDSRKT